MTESPAATVVGPGARSLWRRYRVLLGIALAILVVAVAIGVVQARTDRGAFDPRAVDPSGSRALATLLDERGVHVRRVTTVAEAGAGLSARDIVLVAFPGRLPPESLERFADVPAARVLLVAPLQDALDALSDEVDVAGAAPVQTREPDCGEAAALAAGDAELGGQTYRGDLGTTRCYPADDGATLVVGRTTGGSPMVVLGSGDPLTNDRLDERGNAALMLNLLGADGSADEVRWLVPGPGAAADDGDDLSLSDIAPSWAGPAAAQLLVAALLAALWRGRRLGPPVTEPLPVVVRAAEAVEGRARLYRRARAHDRAGEALRSGALARLVPRLGLGRQAGGEPSPDAVVAAVAARTGQPAADVHAALYGPPPADDAELVRLADTLDSLVRTTLNPEVRRP